MTLDYRFPHLNRRSIIENRPQCTSIALNTDSDCKLCASNRRRKRMPLLYSQPQLDQRDEPWPRLEKAEEDNYCAQTTVKRNPILLKKYQFVLLVFATKYGFCGTPGSQRGLPVPRSRAESILRDSRWPKGRLATTVFRKHPGFLERVVNCFLFSLFSSGIEYSVFAMRSASAPRGFNSRNLRVHQFCPQVLSTRQS